MSRCGLALPTVAAARRSEGPRASAGVTSSATKDCDAAGDEEFVVGREVCRDELVCGDQYVVPDWAGVDADCLWWPAREVVPDDGRVAYRQ
jgi:hypothetical protein